MKLLLASIIGLLVLSSVSYAFATIPPTRAYERIITSNGTVFANNSTDLVNFLGTGVTITGSDNSNTVYFNAGIASASLEGLTNVTDDFCTTDQIRKASGNNWVCADDNVGAGVLNDLTDVTLVGVAYNHILQFVSSSGQWINKLFAINTLSPANDVFVTGINNQTGVITTNQFSINTKDCGTDFVKSVDNATGNVVCATVASSGNATVLQDLGDVAPLSAGYGDILQFINGAFRDVLFKANTIVCSADQQIISFTNSTGIFGCNTFSVNTQSAANDFQITGINNLTGQITRNQFSVNSLTCSGTDKISSINNATGNVVCSTDATGGGTARESLVANWEIDQTKTNIGTAYVDVYTVANSNGEAIRIDTNGKTTVTGQIIWTKVGTGTQACIFVNSGIVLLQMNNLINGINTNATQTIPVALQNSIFNIKPQCKSTTSTDDPIWLHGQVLLR